MVNNAGSNSIDPRWDRFFDLLEKAIDQGSSNQPMNFEYIYKEVQAERDATPRDAMYWTGHPFLRGVGVGLITKIFNTVAINSPAAFRMGFFYGAFSGAANVVTRPLREKIREKVDNPATYVMTHYFLSTVTWVASYQVMKRCAANTGKPYFHIPVGAAIATGLISEALSQAHDDLIIKNKQATKV